MTDLETTSTIWKALADPSRRQILDLLRNGAMTTGQIAANFPGVSRFAVMKHLGVLEETNLVLVRRRGRERWNHLNAVPLRTMYERWVSTLDDQWATSMLDIGRLATAAGGRALHEQERNGTMTDTVALRHLSIEQEHRIAADPAVVFSILTARIGEWWREPYRLLGEDAEIRLDARPGGTLGEFRDDSFALWGTVSVYEPNRTLELTGPCGMTGAVHGVYRFSLEPAGGDTVLKLSHEAIGPIGPDQQNGYDTGWNVLIGNLKRIAESSTNGQR